MNPNENQSPNSAPQETPSPEPVTPPTPEVQPPSAPEPFAPIQSSMSEPVMGTQSEPIVQPSGSRKKLFIIIGGVVGLLLIGAAIYAAVMMSRGDSPIQAAVETVTGETPDVVDRSDGTLSLETKIDKQEALKAQNLTAEVGQQINMSDGFSFMVAEVTELDSYKRTFAGKESTVTPEDGMKFIKVSYVVGSRLSTSDTISFSSFTFDVADTETNTKYYPETFLSSDPLFPEGYYNLDMEKLTSGMQTPFFLYYEVPVDTALYAERNVKYKNYSTNEEIEVIGRVTLE